MSINVILGVKILNVENFGLALRNAESVSGLGTTKNVMRQNTLTSVLKAHIMYIFTLNRIKSKVESSKIRGNSPFVHDHIASNKLGLGQFCIVVSCDAFKSTNY